MADVAARAGVSHMTVSRVLNNVDGIKPTTRTRVVEAIDELGYRRNDAARRLASTRSGLVGVVTSALPQFGPASILVSLEESARAAGYRLTSANVVEVTVEAFRQAVEQLLEQAVEALILVVPHRAILGMTQSFEAEIPVVVVEGDLTTSPLSAGVDNVEGAKAATRHLLDLGHPTVVHVAGPIDWVEAAARADGWRAALHERKRVMPPMRRSGDWSAASGYAIGQDLAQDRSVTAVFAANDQIALGVMRAFVEANRRIPRDVSVVGFDDLPEAAYFCPPLTTVHQPFAALARNAVQLVTEALAGERGTPMPLVRTELVVRDSTGPFLHRTAYGS